VPDVTISVSDELKTEMDAISEVSWSEICSKAILQYISERKNPTPSIELEIQDVKFVPTEYHESGYPTIIASIKILNKTMFNVTIDRILFNVKFYSTKPVKDYNIGSSYDLFRRTIDAGSVLEIQLPLPILKEKITSLSNLFTTTFRCTIRCIIFADGFRIPYSQELWTEIPIDRWKEFTEKALKPPIDLSKLEDIKRY